MSTKHDGMAWLESLAEQYEATARDIRAFVARIRVLSPPSETASISGMHTSPDGGHEVRISEAIRALLARRSPMGPVAITAALDWTRIRTRSNDRGKLVTSTLKSMRDSGDVVRIAHGQWMLSDHRRGPEGGVS